MSESVDNLCICSLQPGTTNAAAPATESAALEPTAAQSIAGLRCLVVDDETVNRRLCVRMLSRLSCASEALEDGDQVLGRLLRDRTGVGPVDASTVFDVILMDITMVRTNVSVLVF